MMVKVIGICGSPRKGGNSDILLDAALEGARTQGAVTEKIVLNDLNFKPCQACGGCDETGVCAIVDDMRSVYNMIEGADAVIVASPVYFNSVSAQMKMMIDRCQCLWVRKYILKKPSAKEKSGIFLCVSGADKIQFFNCCKKVIMSFFATLDIAYFGEICCRGLEAKAAIKNEKTALGKAFKLGAKLAKNGNSA
ncbi:MAG: flavodoxin family protein [Candidatus Omnitrophota bacterium]|nr:flavodoxin family protein [Candidatus Omnitrophota bacterium]